MGPPPGRRTSPPARSADAAAAAVPLQITFRHLDHSPALESRIRVLVGRLEKFHARITHCRVIVASPPAHRRHGALYDFHIEIGLPDEVIAVRHARSAAPAHQDPFVALRDAFRAARRKLEDYRRTRRAPRRRRTGRD